AVPLAKYDQAAVGQGDQPEQVFQEPVEQRIQLERLPEVLGQLQDAAQLVFRVLGEQGRVGGAGLDLFNDGRHAALGGDVLAQGEEAIADLQPVGGGQRPTAGDPHAVEEGPVDAAQVLDEIAAVPAQDLGVPPADGRGRDGDGRVGLPAD